MIQKLKQMRKEVANELIHIPDWPKPQKDLRMIYWRNRMHSLGKKVVKQKNASEVLSESILSLKDEYPDHIFTFDSEFFPNVVV